MTLHKRKSEKGRDKLNKLNFKNNGTISDNRAETEKHITST